LRSNSANYRRPTQLNHLTVYAQLQQKNHEDLARYQHALETLLTAETEAKALIKDLNAALEKLNLKPKHNPPEQATPGENTKGKGKEKESPSDSRNSEDDGKRGGITNRLREAELLLHKVTFLMGDVYHTLGAKYSKEEEEAYTKAELIRRKLLKGESHTRLNHPILIS
jgi:E3 ubiquitin-protein ligase SHPRH